MNELNKYTLSFSGLSIGTHEYNFVVGDRFFACFEEGEIKKGEVTVDINITKQSNMLTLDFTFNGEVEVVCDRCLDEFMQEVDCEERLLIKFSNEEKEDEADVMWINPVDQTVNVAQFIYESISLNLPFQRIHPEGECNPDMTSRFKIVSEDEFEHLFESNDGEWKNQLESIKEKTDNK